MIMLVVGFARTTRPAIVKLPTMRMTLIITLLLECGGPAPLWSAAARRRFGVRRPGAALECGGPAPLWPERPVKSQLSNRLLAFQKGSDMERLAKALPGQRTPNYFIIGNRMREE